MKGTDSLQLRWGDFLFRSRHCRSLKHRKVLLFDLLTYWAKFLYEVSSKSPFLISRDVNDTRFLHGFFLCSTNANKTHSMEIV